MIRVVILLSAISPAFFILGYGIAKARGSWKSEAMWNACFIGAMGAMAAVGLELAVGYLLPPARPLLDAAMRAALAAIAEESIKFFLLVCIAEKNVDARRAQDILVLALAISLGFATLENCLYVTSIGNWRETAALRAVTAVPGHGLDGLAMGTLLMAARLHAESLWRSVCALLLPMALHAAYDFPLLAIAKGADKTVMGIIWVVVLLLSSLFVILFINRMLPKAEAADRASGRDNASVETTTWLIAGGSAGVIAGPLIAAAGFYVEGLKIAAAASMLGIFPVALGIDAIVTGIRRRRAHQSGPPPLPQLAH
jgi:RsiW-degrading membrane proteinase PrsW (M82 family)